MLFFRRRKFVVNRPLQYELLAISIFYVILFTLVLGCTLFLPVILELHRAEGFSEEALTAANQMLYLDAHFWPAVLLSVVLIALHSIRTSHRIAGPLYRFSAVFREIEQGRLPDPISLRKGDYLQTDAEAINRMIDSLRDRMEQVRASEDLLREVVADLARIPRIPETAELQHHAKGISEKADRLADRVRGLAAGS